MRITRPYVAGFALFIVASAIIAFCLWKGPAEPRYNGIALSSWLEGTAGGNGTVSPDMLMALHSNRQEVIPWLLAYLGSDAGPFQRRYAIFYSEASRPSLPGRIGRLGPPGPGNRWSFLKPWLPEPRHYRTSKGHYYGLPLLVELAPGTDFERQTLEFLIAPQSRTGFGNSYTRIDRLRWVGNFTNYPDRVVPVLITGLTNAGTVEVCIGSLQRFGATAVPMLYRLAQSETGYIRPAEVALEQIDTAAYQKLREEKAKSEIP